MDLHIRNNLFLLMFTVINDINSDLNILYGSELQTANSGIGTRNCDIWRKLATQKKQNSDLLKMCMKYFCRSTYNHVKTNVAKKHIY